AGEADKASGESSEKEEGKKRTRRERKTSVNAARVIRGELVVPVVAEGTVRARQQAEIRAEISGRIRRIYVKEGQRVRKGQKIAALDGREYQIAMEEARSRYLNALGLIAVEEDSVTGLVAKDTWQQQVAELEQLERQGKITRDELRARELVLGVEAMRGGTYRRELIEARSGLAQARADEERAKLNLDRTLIRAPFNGVISELTLTEGHHLSTNEVICLLVNNVDLEAEVGVLESDLGGLVVGRPALLIVPALEDTVRVTVDVISPQIDSDSRTCRVLLRVKNEDGRLQAGMFVRASIAGRIYPDKLMVPTESILTRDGRPLLFRVEEEQAKWVYVKLGLRNDRFVEIERVLQGGPLKEGTLVVVSDHLTLTHDAKIKVKRVLDMTVAWASPDAEE
ncbi:MAG: efflux RND transporter periplasmic adaptor subunit, partial [Candidatus Latescibacterota bacterium]